MKSPEFDESAAELSVKKYIDYFQGRCIKADISGDYVDPGLYDRDAGSGAFQKIINELIKIYWLQYIIL